MCLRPMTSSSLPIRDPHEFAREFEGLQLSSDYKQQQQCPELLSAQGQERF